MERNGDQLDLRHKSGSVIGPAENVGIELRVRNVNEAINSCSSAETKPIPPCINVQCPVDNVSLMMNSTG